MHWSSDYHSPSFRTLDKLQSRTSASSTMRWFRWVHLAHDKHSICIIFHSWSFCWYYILWFGDEVPRVKLRALYMLDKCSVTRLHSQQHCYCFIIHKEKHKSLRIALRNQWCNKWNFTQHIISSTFPSFLGIRVIATIKCEPINAR